MTLLKHLRRRGEAGSQSLSLVMWTPVFVMLICFLFAAFKVWNAHTAIEQAAQAAARDASLTRTAEQGYQRGMLAGQDWLKIQNAPCKTSSVTVDTSGYRVPLGQTGFVEITITCTVSFSDLFLPGIPGETTITKTGISAIDPYRERQ